MHIKNQVRPIKAISIREVQSTLVSATCIISLVRGQPEIAAISNLCLDEDSDFSSVFESHKHTQSMAEGTRPAHSDHCRHENTS
jgi:hypothetical protein